MVVGSLEDATDLMGDVSIEGIPQELSKTASANEFESSGKGTRIVKKSKEHIEAERNLRG